MLDNTHPESLRLSQLQSGRSARVIAINGGKELHRKLLALGLRVGVEISLLQHRNRGVVIATSSGTRLAIGAGIAEKLLLQPLPEDLGSTDPRH